MAEDVCASAVIGAAPNEMATSAANLQMLLLAPNPRKPEIILFLNSATASAVVMRIAVKPCGGGAHVAAAAHASTLIGVCVCVCVCV